MDKETLSNYGWIVICVLILAVLLALASPFGMFVADAVKATTAGFFSVNQNAMGAAGITIPGQEFESCEHEYEMTGTTANCTTAGTTTHTCKLCGKSYSEETPAGHTFDNASDMNCNVCNTTFTIYIFNAHDYREKTGTATMTDTTIVIPETFEYDGTNYKVYKIDTWAFSNYDSLENITIPNSVVAIKNNAFCELKSLAIVNMTNSVTNIEDYAFAACKALTTINYEGTMEQWNAVTKSTYWNRNALAIEVICIDGVITIPAWS